MRRLMGFCPARITHSTFQFIRARGKNSPRPLAHARSYNVFSTTNSRTYSIALVAASASEWMVRSYERERVDVLRCALHSLALAATNRCTSSNLRLGTLRPKPPSRLTHTRV